MINQINVKKLRDYKLFVGTPMYGGQCTGEYTKSCLDLAMACSQHGIPLSFYYLFNESLITRARNYIVDEFLRSDATHLLFIDSDIGFEWQYALILMELAVDGKDVVCAPYPKKSISWEKIRSAVEKGYAANPFELENFVGDFVFNPEPGITEFAINDVIPVMEAGTGFMMIRRETLEAYAREYPELSYRPDHTRSEKFDGSREIHAYFDCVIDPESRRYLSEDYMFCQNVRRAGMHIWLCPFMNLRHVGSYTFRGNMSAIAAVGASPTADETSNKKHYEMQPKLAATVKKSKLMKRGPARR